MMIDIYNKVLQEVKEVFINFRKSHDWEHTERVLNLCLRIGGKEGADIEVLRFAAILHDIGREEQDKKKGLVCHAEIGAEMAKDILVKHNLNSEFIDKVIHCIKTHRFRGKNIPESKEAKILYDADKLDAIGAIGIGRAFVFAGEVGAKVHNKHADIENTKSYTEEDTAYREFMVKLRKIKDKMLTYEGKNLAQGRHDFMVEFFKRMDDEVEGKI